MTKSNTTAKGQCLHLPSEEAVRKGIERLQQDPEAFRRMLLFSACLYSSANMLRLRLDKLCHQLSAADQLLAVAELAEAEDLLTRTLLEYVQEAKFCCDVCGSEVGRAIAHEGLPLTDIGLAVHAMTCAVELDRRKGRN